MRILLVSYEFPPHMNTGGIGSYMHHLAHLLSNAGYNVTVFSATWEKGSVNKEVTSYCTNYVFYAPTLHDFREAVRSFFHEFIQQQSVDLIESSEVGACALGIKQDHPDIPLLVRLHTPGVIITKVSNTYQPFWIKLRYVLGALRRGKLDLGFWSISDKNRFNDPEYKICMLADQLVSPSRALATKLKRYWLLDKEIKVVPNPFHADEDLFHYPIEGREKLICFVGKLTVLKGMFTLTRAVKKILLQHKDYRFVFAGRDEAASPEIPSMRVWMEEQLQEVLDRVEFTGALSRQQVKELLGKSRICVVPSLWENYPTVLLEAMAAGAAVAAANRGGIPEIIANGKTGFLFNPLRADEIMRKVHLLITDEEKRQATAMGARTWLKLSQENMSQVIIDLYRTVSNNN